MKEQLVSHEEQARAHRFFSAECFNRVWRLLDKPERSPEETEEMLHLAHTSLWHWMQRSDVTAEHRSIGYWQLARVYAAAGLPDRASSYGERSLAESSADEVDPFYVAYAHEAIARARAIQSRVDEARQHLDAARALMPTSMEKDLSMLEDDLGSIEDML